MKWSIRLLMLAALAASFIISGPGSFSKDFSRSQDSAAITYPHLSKDSQTLAMKITPSTSNGFALKLFSGVAKNGKENILLSPFSAYTALSMALNGAGGKTRDRIAAVLGLSSATIDQLNARNQAISTALTSSPSVQMEIANAIYTDRSTPFKKSFVELCQKIYHAEARSEDFNDPATVRAINAWCDSKTHGKISQIVDKLGVNDKMVLLNTIYFKGAWEHKFTKSSTSDDKFTGTGGDKIPIKMMHQIHDCLYYKGPNFASVSFPYAGRTQNMLIFLPDQGVDITTFQSQFSTDNWNKWMKSYNLADIKLSLPRFKISYSKKLNDALSAMGMADAFSKATADFSEMIKPPAWISSVLQKTYMDVNEDGTEAAAVTAVAMMGARAIMSRPEPVIEFRVDRPFVVAIVDNESNELLFLGTVVKP